VDDPAPGNNSATSASAATVVVLDVSDVKVQGVVVAAPGQAFVGAPFDVTATVDVHNNGPYGPTNVDTTGTLSLPPDCSTTDSNPLTAQDASAPVSVLTAVDVVWSVTCTSQSFHTFTADVTISVDQFHVTDPTAANDSGQSIATDLAVFSGADGKIVSAVALSPPFSIPASTNVNITVRKVLHNNGPTGPVDFELSKTVTAPPACSVTAPALSVHNLSVSAATTVDEVWVINCSSGGPYSITFSNTLSATGFHIADPTPGNNAGSVLLTVIVDSDSDGIPDVAESACGSNPNDGGSIPERVDGAFSGVDDDGDTSVDEALPGGSGGFDCDGDGFVGTTETHVFSGATDRDQDPCGTDAWGADIVAGGIPDSTNKVNLADIVAFIAPVRHFGNDVGTNPGDVRFDLVPGKGFLLTDINISDLAKVTVVSPPMLGGVRAFGGPSCPWPP
jgi:hypothetical protein